MPSKPRAKIFRAVRPFSTAGSTFAVGDVVPSGAALATALRHGDAFVTSETSRTAEPADETTTTTTTPKEG